MKANNQPKHSLSDVKIIKTNEQNNNRELRFNKEFLETNDKQEDLGYEDEVKNNNKREGITRAKKKLDLARKK